LAEKNPGEPFMSRKIYLAISLLLVAALVAAWYFFAPSRQSAAENNDDIPDLGAEAPISVKVQYARQGMLVLRLTANGYTARKQRASPQVPFTAQISGAVDSVRGRRGEWETQRGGEREQNGLW
jgi:hypothetical protein